jgi:hypothetical protein
MKILATVFGTSTEYLKYNLQGIKPLSGNQFLEIIFINQ